LSGSRDRIHLRRDRIEEGLPVVAFLIQVEMGAIVDVGEVRVGIEALEHGLEFVGSAVEIEGVGGSYDDVNFPSQIWATLRPVCRDDVSKIVVVAPVCDYPGIHVACLTAEHLQGTAVGSAWREYPFERSKLAAVVSQDALLAGKLLHRRLNLVVISHNRRCAPVGTAVKIGVCGVEIRRRECVKVAGVR
jgi:hypothetical protein